MSQNNSLRKSVKKEAKKGNKVKYDAYTEAFTRIKAANESNFFLEAVAIQEAIISDRLKSHLGHLGRLPKKKHPTLHDLVKAWKREIQGKTASSLPMKLTSGEFYAIRQCTGWLQRTASTISLKQLKQRQKLEKFWQGPFVIGTRKKSRRQGR